jgi:hypothetical protein
VILTLALAVRAERGLLRSTARSIRALLADVGLTHVEATMHQPLPVYRIMLHPRFGSPGLGARPGYQRWAKRFDRLFARLIPKRWWAYAVVSGRKP